MRRIVMRLLALCLAAALLAGCGEGVKQQVGALMGAGLGGLAGSFIGDGRGQLLAVGVGTLLGSLVGSEVGKSLDRADRLAMAQAQHEALENGESGSKRTWRNPDSDNSGEIVVEPAYLGDSGRYCRNFRHTVTVAGEKQVAYGTACREPGGTWRLI